ncbi:MAG: calcium-binding protein [Pseudomonadota bacterium]
MSIFPSPVTVQVITLEDSVDKFVEGVAALPDGGFAVAWDDSNASNANNASSGYAIFDGTYKLVGSGGTPGVSGNDLDIATDLEGDIVFSVERNNGTFANLIGVGTSTSAGFSISSRKVALAPAEDGIVFATQNTASDIAVGFYNPTQTSFVTLEVIFNASGSLFDIDIARLANGGYAVGWRNPLNNELNVQFISGTLDTVGATVTLPGGTSATNTTMTALENGNLLVTWQASGGGFDTDGSGIMGTIISPYGQEIVPPRSLNLSTKDDQFGHDIVQLSDGTLFLTYISFHEGEGVYGVRLTSDLVPTGGEVFIDDGSSAIFVGRTHTTELTDGRIVTLYTDFANASEEVRARVIDLRGPELEGTSRDDYLTARDADTTIWAGLGDDTIIGFSGDDLIYGGSGGDYIATGLGDNTVYGDSGSDTIVGRVFDDTVFGGSGSDDISLDGGDNFADGGSGSDSLTGFTGDDTLIGGSGLDRVTLGGGVDTADGGSGRDELILEGLIQSVVDLKAGTVVSQNGTAAITSFSDVTATGGAENITAHDGENVINANGGADTVTALGGSDLVFGGDGADIIYGGNGADQLFGGDQGDSIFGGDGEDEVYGGVGPDELRGGAGRDTIYGGDNADSLRGGDQADDIYGGGANDSILGENGGDTIRGGGGNDSISGGRGNDTILGDEGNDTLRGGDGTDKFRFFDGFGRDTITDFDTTLGAEDIDLSNVSEITDFTDLTGSHMAQNGNDIWITDGNDRIILVGINIGDLDSTDFIF